MILRVSGFSPMIASHILGILMCTQSASPRDLTLIKSLLHFRRDGNHIEPAEVKIEVQKGAEGYQTLASFDHKDYEILKSPSGVLSLIRATELDYTRAEFPTSLSVSDQTLLAAQLLSLVYGSASKAMFIYRGQDINSERKGLASYDFRLVVNEIPVESLTGFGKFEFYCDTGEVIIARIPELPSMQSTTIQVSDLEVRQIAKKAVSDLLDKSHFSEITITSEAVRLDSMNPKCQLYKAREYGVARSIRRIVFKVTSKKHPTQSGLVAVLIDGKTGIVVRRDVFSAL